MYVQLINVLAHHLLLHARGELALVLLGGGVLLGRFHFELGDHTVFEPQRHVHVFGRARRRNIASGARILAVGVAAGSGSPGIGRPGGGRGWRRRSAGGRGLVPGRFHGGIGVLARGTSCRREQGQAGGGAQQGLARSVHGSPRWWGFPGWESLQGSSTDASLSLHRIMAARVEWAQGKARHSQRGQRRTRLCLTGDS